jgi:CBS domain-containing protein
MAAVERRYPALRDLRVAEAMHPGLITCPPDAPLRTVARMMATYRVHAILVHAHGREAPPWGVVTDVELLRAAGAGDVGERTAGEAAAAPPLTVKPADDLADAARLLLDHGVSHAVVVEGRPPRPVGMLSTLDVARALADFPERHPAHG